MKLNNKGFAITSIIYSMLILFLTLVVLIISNLASRKAIFDKQKEDILDKLGQSEEIDLKICRYTGTEESSKYELGAKYECDPGDGEIRTFYILEVGTNPVTESTLEANQIALIMDSNIDDTAVKWCKTSDNNNCAADGAVAALQTKTSDWEQVIVTLPSIYQIGPVASECDCWSIDGYGTYNIKESYSWLTENLDKDTVKGYWTLTKFNYINTQAWNIDYDGINEETVNDNTIGVGIRPVIIISKADLG